MKIEITVVNALNQRLMFESNCEVINICSKVIRSGKVKVLTGGPMTPGVPGNPLSPLIPWEPGDPDGGKGRNHTCSINDAIILYKRFTLFIVGHYFINPLRSKYFYLKFCFSYITDER